VPDSTDPVLGLRDDELDRLYRGLRCYATLIVAVSGGPDSLALMESLARWTRLSGASAAGLQVVTIDHGLRSGAAAEAEFVAAAAATLGLPHRTRVWDGPKPASAIQEAARGARYALLAEIASAAPQPAAIVTAHHAEDQAETVLMRLARGSGLDGLAGMAAERPLGGVVLVRPLLAVPKARLLATLAERGLSAVEDPSNVNPAFERVRLRRAWPALQAVGLDAAQIVRSARRLERARQALEAATDALARVAAQDHAGAYAEIDASAWRAAPEELRARLLGRALAAFGGDAAPARLSQIEDLVAALGAEDFPGATLGGCRIETRRRAAILVYREAGRSLPALALAPGEKAAWDNRFVVQTTAAEPVLVRAPTPAELAHLAADGLDLGGMPRDAAATLPSFWQDGRLIGLPRLRRTTGGDTCTARFLHDLTRSALEFPSATGPRGP
jgi:tRNA(Ile)-lysidine synthase